LADRHKRRELIEGLFNEILERFGDREGGRYEAVVRSGRSCLRVLDMVIREGKREALFRHGL